EFDNPVYKSNLYRIQSVGGCPELLYNDSRVSGVTYSPDGTWIAFIGGELTHRQLFVIPSNGGEATCLSEQYPYPLENLSFSDMVYIHSLIKPLWSKDNRYIYTLGSYLGTTEIVRFSLLKDIAPVTVIGGERIIFHFSFDGENTIVAAYMTANHPGKVSAI